MTVGELIKILQTCDPSLPVARADCDFTAVSLTDVEILPHMHGPTSMDGVYEGCYRGGCPKCVKIVRIGV